MSSTIAFHQYCQCQLNVDKLVLIVQLDGGPSVYPVPARMLPDLTTVMPPTQGVTVTGKQSFYFSLKKKCFEDNPPLS